MRASRLPNGNLNEEHVKALLKLKSFLFLEKSYYIVPVHYIKTHFQELSIASRPVNARLIKVNIM